MKIAAEMMSGMHGLQWILMDEIVGDDNNEMSAQGETNNRGLRKVQTSQRNCIMSLCRGKEQCQRAL